ncbi:MAG: hypothetical protein KDD14_26195, partial [Saprospiraceae bacterium]|nr:hypothetical protein [Saprospiraceae bacterium]
GTEHDVDGIKHVIFAGGGYSGSGTIVTEEGVVHWSHWIGGHGGPNGNKGPGTSLAYCGGNFNAGGLGFGGGGSGVGSGGGGGGFSGGGGGGLVGPGGGGGGGGGGSYVNPAYGESFSVVMHQRGTTSNPADGSIKYKFASIDPIATRDLGFEAHKGTEVSVLKAGDWTLLWQYDGNLVLYGPGFPNGAWASNTAGTDLFFQGDGNLVIYQAN